MKVSFFCYIMLKRKHILKIKLVIFPDVTYVHVCGVDDGGADI